jgi:hypothetical protein
MNLFSLIAIVVLASLLGACGSTGVATTSAAKDVSQASTTALPATTHDTVLLVSLEDGSVVMQTIETGADFCFKKNSESSTTCLTRGEPIIDPVTNNVIGFEMIENHIELIAKSD